MRKQVSAIDAYAAYAMHRNGDDMTKAELWAEIDRQASKYLNFQTHIAGLQHRNRAQLQETIARLKTMNTLVEKANAIINKYENQQWQAAIIFGIEDTGVAQADLDAVDTMMHRANELWLIKM